MKKYFLLFFVVGAALLTAACQYPVYLVVINSSTAPVEYFEYRKDLNSSESASGNYFRVANAQDFESGSYKAQPLPPERFAFDKEKGSFKAVIEPNEVLFIADSFDHSPEPFKYLDGSYEKFVLNGSHGLVSYEGQGVYKQFERRNRSWFSFSAPYYFVRYR